MFKANNSVFEFDHQLINTFEFVQVSKNEFDPSLENTSFMG